MTAYTPNISLPYPLVTDPPRGNEQIQQLAEALDSQLIWGFAYRTSDYKTDGSTGLQAVPLTFGGGGGMSGGGSNPARGIKVETAGYYQITVAMRWQVPADGNFGMGFSHSATPGNMFGSQPSVSGVSNLNTLAGVSICAAGDVLYPTADGYNKVCTINAVQMMVRYLGPGTETINPGGLDLGKPYEG